MSLILFAIAALSPVSPPNDGDAILAVAWERQRDRSLPALQCIHSVGSMADDIRHSPVSYLRRLTTDERVAPPAHLQRLRRIAQGEGRSPAIDVERLGVPPQSPACKYRYAISAPVIIDDYAYIHISQECGLFCGSAEVLALQYRDGVWQVSDVLGTMIV